MSKYRRGLVLIKVCSLVSSSYEHIIMYLAVCHLCRLEFFIGIKHPFSDGLCFSSLFISKWNRYQSVWARLHFWKLTAQSFTWCPGKQLQGTLIYCWLWQQLWTSRVLALHHWVARELDQITTSICLGSERKKGATYFKNYFFFTAVRRTHSVDVMYVFAAM